MTDGPNVNAHASGCRTLRRCWNANHLSLGVRARPASSKFRGTQRRRWQRTTLADLEERTTVEGLIMQQSSPATSTLCCAGDIMYMRPGSVGISAA